MFLIGFIGMIYGLLMIVGLPYALISQRRLAARVARLEHELANAARAEAEPAPTPATVDIPEPLPEPPATTPETERPGPWDIMPAAAPPEPPRPAPGYVLRAENFERLGIWLRANWTLAIAALSLIFGGLFMVQYGVERGLLTPPMRVLGALALGAALVAGGEWLRRGHGDIVTPATRHLPSTFAGAGVVVLFIGLLSANVLYGLVGAGPALAGIALVAAGAVVMGWVYGAVLPAVGLLGAAAAPFLISSSTTDATPLYAYFAILGLAGLAIDSFRRWAWVSALALALACAGLTLVHLQTGSAPWLIGACLTLGFGALTIPERRLVPVLTGAPLFPHPRARAERPAFPTLVGGAGILIATGAAGLVALAPGGTPAEFGLALAALVVVFLAIALWLNRAEPLDLTIALPALAFLGVLAAQPVLPTVIYTGFRAHIEAPPETPLPGLLWWLMAAAGAMAAAATLRLNRIVAENAPDAPARALPWSVAAAAILPATALVLEFLWSPREVLGNYPWAMAAMAGAAFLVLLVQRRATQGGASLKRDIGLLAAAAFLMIALALFLLLTAAALTLSLALLMALAALLDRRFDLPVLAWVAQLGAAVIGYRLLIDPGLDHAIDRAGWIEFLLSHLGAIAGFEAVRRLARDDRPALGAVAESALITTAAMTATLTIARQVGIEERNFWLPGLTAAPWAAAAMAQIWRIAASGRAMRVLRAIFALVSTVVALLLAATEIGVIGWMACCRSGILVNGPPILDGLALAFLPLALTLALGAWALGLPGRPLARLMRAALGAGAALTGALWGFYEIRRLWRGPDLSAPGPSDGELYSYTLAMLIVSLGLLALAVMRRSETLRRVAMAGVALTIVKVFLLDMGGLSGLTRVASFVGLGLALTGLAWINRRIDALWLGSATRG